MLKDRERTRLLLDAPDEKLAKIDDILLGRKSADPKTARMTNLKTFSVTEAAKQLNLCRKSVYKLIKSGLLKTIPFGNRFRIANNAIEDYLTSK